MDVELLTESALDKRPVLVVVAITIAHSGSVFAVQKRQRYELALLPDSRLTFFRRMF